MREVIFALGYMPHRLWGNILQAQFLEKETDQEFYVPSEYIQNDPSTKAYQRLTPMQRTAVKYMDAYNDRKLHQAFSKKKTVKEFQDTVDRETIREHIRPYIERYMYKILEIARDNSLHIFVKDKSNRNVFEEDFIKIEKHSADPLFSFIYRENLSYALNLIHGEHRLVLNTSYVEIVCQKPCVVLLGDRLFFINEIDGKKLKPFLEKDQVSIPAEVEEKYFGSFVRNTLRDFKTYTEGIAIRELVPTKEAELVLEEGLHDQPVWILSYRYNGQSVYGDSKTSRFINYSGRQGSPVFERFERDFSWEESKAIALNELGFSSRDGRRFYLNKKFTSSSEAGLYTAIHFVNESSDYLDEAAIKFRHRLNQDYYLGKIKLHLESTEKEDWFDLHIVVHFASHKVSFFQLKNHILEGNREYVLPDGKVAILPEEWFVRYRSIFEFGKIEKDRILVHKQHFSMMEGPVRDVFSKTLSRLQKLNQVASLPETGLPVGLNAVMRSYQVEGYKWLCFLQKNGFGGCLADDMGLGKTLQAIAVILRSKERLNGQKQNKGKPAPVPEIQAQLTMFEARDEKLTSLIVAPASLMHNWKSEILRFAPGIRVFTHTGSQRNKALTNFFHYDVILSTYHTVRQDISSLASFPFHYVILDESQMIKNPSSKLYQSVIELQSDHKLVLTGTPIENSLTDLWSQINFVNPGLLGTLSFFKRSFVYTIEKKNDEQREQKLKELINPFILRRTKQEVAQELPPVYEQIRYCNMTEGQRRFYEEEKSLARNSILENLEEIGLEKSSMVVLQALTRLRQIANHPALVEEPHAMDSGKFTEVYRDIESVLSEGHKVLMFSSFVKHLNLFRNRLDEDGLNYAYLTGTQNHRQRAKAVKEFQTNPHCSLFLISLKAGGVGLNLTAADYVFILDPWWNPAAEMQALNRAHRIGQDKSVFVYRFISNDTIEEKIQRLQARKRELAEAFVSSNNPLKSLTEKELLELFS
jgi:SNF2 family DNA or RNA helicase